MEEYKSHLSSGSQKLTMLEVEILPSHLDPMMAIADTMIGPINPDAIRDKVSSKFPMERLEEYCNLIPSKIPDFRQLICDKVNGSGIDASRLLVVVMSLLSSRIAAPVLTKSTTLITEMTPEQRITMLRLWRDSPLSVNRKLYKSFSALILTTYQTIAGELHNLAIGRPTKELRERLYEGAEVDSFRFTMIDRVKSDSSDLHLPNIDVLIVGSGAGAGVVAHTLQSEGFNCLVLERGKYYAPSEYIFDDLEGLKNLYEKAGALASTSQEIFVLAGSAFGGGTTVNWSACIKTPFKVRKEWYDDFGVDFVADEEYEQCMDYVFKQIGANHEGINHSHSNRAILNSAGLLGYHAAEVNQNNGVHKNHDCGFCYLGCKYGIKQGSQACWLRDAAEHGCQFLDEVEVREIIHKHGKAIGVNCVDKKTGYHFKITGPKKIVVSAGSLHTPLLLKDSGFKNKHIGSNLKLHPVTVMTAFHDRKIETEPHNFPIMTAVSNQVADLDGKAHGPRIETILHAPFIEACFVPWDTSNQLRTDLLKYNQTSSMLIITRDTGSGKVCSDPRRPGEVLVDYNVNKFDANALLEGFLCAADMLYMDGAVELVSSQAWVPRFESYKPKAQRSITDKDYVEWRANTKKAGHYKYGPTYGSAHQMSTCRMSGKGPKYGAVDLKGKLFESSNVYVADASVLPTASGANPMISTLAMARHIATDLVKDMKKVSKL